MCRQELSIMRLLIRRRVESCLEVMASAVELILSFPFFRAVNGGCWACLLIGKMNLGLTPAFGKGCRILRPMLFLKRTRWEWWGSARSLDSSFVMGCWVISYYWPGIF